MSMFAPTQTNGFNILKFAFISWVILPMATGCAFAEFKPADNAYRPKTPPFSAVSLYSAKPTSMTPPQQPNAATVQKPIQSPYNLLYGAILKTEAMPISLDDVLTRVAKENLFIRRKIADERIERSNFYTQLIDPLPDFKGIYGHRRFQGAIQLFGNDTLIIRQTSIEPRIAVRQHIDLGGKQVFNILQARKKVQAAESMVESTLQQRLAESAETYYRFLEALFVKESAELGVEEADAQIKIAEARLNQGVGTRLETMQATSLHAQRVQALIEAEKSIATEEEALLNAMNLNSTLQLMSQTHQPTQQRLLPTSTKTADLIAHSQSSHPELQTLRRQEEALKWGSRSVLSDILPSVNLDAYVSYKGPYYDSLGLTRSAGLSVETQLFDKLGLKVPVAYLGAKRQLEAKRLETEHLIRNLSSKIMNAQLENARSEQQIIATEQEKNAAEEAYRLATQRYKIGVGTQIDMLEAARSASDSRAKWVQAIMSFNRAQVDLLTSSGQVTIPNLLGHLMGSTSLFSTSSSPIKGAP